jgi:hypothetical protein
MNCAFLAEDATENVITMLREKEVCPFPINSTLHVMVLARSFLSGLPSEVPRRIYRESTDALTL